MEVLGFAIYIGIAVFLILVGIYADIRKKRRAATARTDNMSPAPTSATQLVEPNSKPRDTVPKRRATFGAARARTAKYHD
jgi:hypothetical protein